MTPHASLGNDGADGILGVVVIDKERELAARTLPPTYGLGIAGFFPWSCRDETASPLFEIFPTYES